MLNSLTYAEAVVIELRGLLDSGFAPHDIALVARTKRLLNDRAAPAFIAAGVEVADLGETDEVCEGKVSMCTMHRAKGLEFRAVVALGCEARSVPFPIALSSARDDGERETVIEQERHLLHVSCTRARERLLVTCVGDPSHLLPVRQD